MFHPDRQAGTSWTQEILPLAREEKSNKDTHTSALSPYVRHTHTHARAGAAAECALRSARSRAVRPQQVEHQGGRSERVDGCLLQTQWPGPPVGEFAMCSLTLNSHFYFVHCVFFLFCLAKNRWCIDHIQFSCKEFDIVVMSASFLLSQISHLSDVSQHQLASYHVKVSFVSLSLNYEHPLLVSYFKFITQWDHYDLLRTFYC